LRAQLRRTRQAPCVCFRQSGSRDHPLVARHLAFQVQPVTEERDRRMDPEHRLEHRLRQAGPVIPPLHVRVFVQHDLVEILGRNRVQQRRRQEDVRATEAEHRRTGHIVAQHQPRWTPFRPRLEPQR